MLAVLSPAKTLDYETPLPPVDATEPRFAAEASRLAASAARLSAKRLGQLMHISPALATLNMHRFRDFDGQSARPALFAFAGDVYTGLDAATLDEAAIDFAQDHLRMLSGLYGLLRPLDAIRPYRLEMGTRWAPRHKKLTDWWGARIADRLAGDCAAEGSGTVLNLASKEYWAAVDGRLPADLRIIHVDFRERRGDALRFVTFNAKKARGAMARWLIEHRHADVEAMKECDAEDYRFDADGSTSDNWLFVRG